MKIEPTDIVNRIAHAKPEFWFGSKPKIKLTGEDNTFGILSFEFDDDIIKYKILIKNRINILNASKEAVKNFKLYCIQMFD